MTGVDLWGARGAHAPYLPKINGYPLSPSFFRRKNEERGRRRGEQR